LAVEVLVELVGEAARLCEKETWWRSPTT